MTTDLNKISVQKDGSFALSANSSSYNLALSANTAKSLTLPSGASHVFFSSSEDFWVAWTKTGESDVTAAIPAADNTAGSAPELNPTQRHVEGISKISVISATAQNVNIVVFKS